MDFCQFTQWGYELIGTLGYLGLFLANLISTSTVVFPLPGYILIFIFGGILNPWLVALSAALGSAIGEGVSYGLGRGEDIFLKKSRENIFSKRKNGSRKIGDLLS